MTDELRVPGPEDPCPLADLCLICPRSDEDDVCLPAERFDLELRRLYTEEDMRLAQARPIARRRAGLEEETDGDAS